MTKKLTSLFLASTFILSACSKGTEKTVYVQQEQKTDNAIKGPLATPLLRDWQDLLMDGNTSMQIAEILASEVVAKDRGAVKELLKDFDQNDIKGLYNEIQAAEKKIRAAYFHQNASWSNNQDFLKSTIVTQPNVAALSANSISNRILFTVTAQARNKLLNEIMDTYSKRMTELAADMAPTFAQEIQEQHPRDVREIEDDILRGDKEEAQKKLQKIVQGLKKFDEFFRDSGLNAQEQSFLVLSAGVSGAIAYKIYDQVKDNKSFKKVVELAKNAKEIQKKFKELQVLTKSLNEYTENFAKDTKEFAKASKAVVSDIGEVFDKVKEEGIRTNVDVRKSFQYIYDKTIGGKKKSDSTDLGTTIATQTWKIDPNVQIMVSSAERITSNFSAILENTQAIASKFGIKVSPEVGKLIEKANKINQTINMASKVMAGFATGGVLGAVQAFASGPLGSIMGGGGSSFEGSVMSQFKLINQKLDEIIKLQKQMISLQIETMGMIQKLALLIDQYHQKEMSAIASVKNISVVNLEISKMNMNEGIRNCEGIVNFHVYKGIPGDISITKPGLDANIAEMNAQKLYDQLGNFEGAKRFIRSTHDDAFSSCQNGIAQAFSRGYLAENPILSIFSSDDKNDLKEFYDKNYYPLYKVIANKVKNNSTISMALHAPVEKIEHLERKHIYTNGRTGDSDKNIYDMENLISPLALERYAAQLLILHPYLELDKSDWEKDVTDIFNAYLGLANDDLHSTRSLYLLRNALAMTQSAIAQEAILSGEPIMDKLHEKLADIFKLDDPCDGFSMDGYAQDAKACAIRSNGLLLKNLMSYSLHRNVKDLGYRFEDYAAAYSAKNIAELERVLFDRKVTGKIQVKENKLEFVVLKGKDNRTVTMPLPEPKELKDGYILYSENMQRLISLQDKLLDALVKITPSDALEQADKEKLAAFILSKYVKD